MCTVLLPPGDNPIAVNKYIMSYFLLEAAIVITTKRPCYAIVFTVVLAKDTGSVAKGLREYTKDNMDHLYLEEKNPYYMY
jgi:hypothetical protein